MAFPDLNNLPMVQMRPLSDAVRREAFCCGDDDIDIWYKKKCDDHHGRYLTRVQTAHDPETGAFIGFYCLSIALEDERLLQNGWKQLVRARERNFAALRLDIIAVKKESQRQGYGTRLLATALDDFYYLIGMIGIPAMILTCSEKVKPSFYEQFGFAKYGREVLAPRMFLPARSVIEAYAAELAEH